MGSGNVIDILIVEDNPADAELVVYELKRAGMKFTWRRVDSEAAFAAELENGANLILSDFEMPHFSGLRALELLKQRSDLEIPFILISGTIGEETAVAAIRQGASDYILKDRIVRLAPAITQALERVAEQKRVKELQAQFLEAQKMEVVGQLAGGVAHDFNNVLAVIIGYSDLISQELPPEHSLQKYIAEVRQASKRASGLTQQLLIFSRKSTVQPVEMDLNDAVEDMEKMLKQLINENIELTIHCRKGIGRIKADPGYIWQVLMNMVVNARDAMLNGGRIVVETDAVVLDEKDVAGHEGIIPGNYIMLSVQDTGAGMTDEVKARLFEAFFTTKPKGKGTGLGLLTCHTIVKQSDGFIDVISEPGKGTTFKIYFPQAGSSVRTVEPAAPKQVAPPRGTETLLVVEDDRSLRHLANGILTGLGYNVLTASNGQEALSVVREHHGEPIALVITDIVMPRMGGKVMAEWLKISHPQMKILFTSGYTEDTIAHHGVLERGIEFLLKPYSPATLARKIRDILDAPAQS